MPLEDPRHPRRELLDVAKRLFLEAGEKRPSATLDNDVPRLTLRALERLGMSRSRERILANLDEMYREAFDRAKASQDATQMATLDFDYRREQLYFEILLDIRDAMERRG